MYMLELVHCTSRGNEYVYVHSSGNARGIVHASVLQVLWNVMSTPTIII